MENSNQLFESIFNRNLSDADTLGYLENTAAEHPYFTAAQFYLLLKTDKNNFVYNKQVQKTAALFNNNYWLNYLLTVSAKPEQIFAQSPVETIADVKAPVGFYEIPATEELLPAAAEGSNLNGYDAITETPNGDEKKLLNEPEKSVVLPLLNEHNHYVEATNGDLTDAVKGPTIQEEAVSFEPGINQSPESTAAKDHEAINEPIIASGSEITAEGTTVSVNVIPAVEEQANKTSVAATDNTSEALLFQPLYTSDYFASVGIKLSEDANSSDRLGKQLKSFTQWLKTMKKIDTQLSGPLLPAEIGSENVDHNIKTLAEKSNKDEDIITEAMADVLVQQGRINKAVEVLKKLSLLNPSKSTYFAAKIEQLKD